MKLIQGECLEEMKNIPDGSVDMILADPPYGTTACKWDSIIPLEPMWEQLKRVTKDSGAVVLFGSEPFSSSLRMSNIKNYKYDWVWEKSRPTLFQHANRLPLKDNECISVFNSKVYYPQGLINKERKVKRTSGGGTFGNNWNSNNEYTSKYTNYPRRILKIPNEKAGLHPTQKPVALMEYLIKTYTNECETVLDFTMGSGTTGVACANLNREFIGIELDPDYFQIAKSRIEGLQSNHGIEQTPISTQDEQMELFN